MAFTNSPLVVYTRISPNRNSPRNQPITKITVHHMAGVCSVEDFGNIVASASREMSANYAIGNDGRIGLFCPESDRSWCSSSAWNDNRAITIEVSNSSVGGDWPIGTKAYNSLIKLCVDICKRNGIKKLYFDGTQNGSLTFHYMFASTACPGPWMKAHANDLCNKVNAQLNSSSSTTQPTTPSQPTTSFKVGDLVKINAGARYYGGGAIPQWVVNEKWYISSISGDRAVLGLNEAKNRNIQSPINTKDITLVKTQTTTFKEYTKSFKGTDKIYGTAGGAVVGTIGTSGIYTIVDEKTVGTVTYGKLKSGKGWVIVRQQEIQLKKGDKVRVLNPIIYGTNKKFTTYVSVYYVLEVNGDRVVISSDGKNVTTAIAKSNLQKV
jgi:hypothetical protein